MLIFIDDSGDPGLRFNPGSSDYLVISLVIFDDHLEAEKTALAIKDLRHELRVSHEWEFKFTKLSKNLRERFLRHICHFHFRVRNLIIRKSSFIHNQEMYKDQHSFYSYAIKMAIQHSSSTISDASIQIDGKGDRVSRRDFLRYIRGQLNTDKKCIIKQCKLVDSRSSMLIQLADMIAGSIHRSYHPEKSDAKLYKSIIQERIENELFLS